MMKKRSAQLFICALTVGIATIAGITGIAAIKKSAKAIKTVEYTMPKNLNGIYYASKFDEPCITIVTNNEYKNITECDSIGEVVRGLPRNLGYKRLYLKGYDGEVLAITDNIKIIDGKNTSHIAFFFTKTHGEHVHFVGRLDTNNTDGPLRKNDGIIYVPESFQFNAYIVSSDGKSFEKESDISYHPRESSCSGFYHGTNYNNTSVKKNDLVNKILDDIKNTPVIDFEIKK